MQPLQVTPRSLGDETSRDISMPHSRICRAKAGYVYSLPPDATEAIYWSMGLLAYFFIALIHIIAYLHFMGTRASSQGRRVRRLVETTIFLAAAAVCFTTYVLTIQYEVYCKPAYTDVAFPRLAFNCGIIFAVVLGLGLFGWLFFAANDCMGILPDRPEFVVIWSIGFVACVFALPYVLLKGIVFILMSPLCTAHRVKELNTEDDIVLAWVRKQFRIRRVQYAGRNNNHGVDLRPPDSPGESGLIPLEKLVECEEKAKFDQLAQERVNNAANYRSNDRPPRYGRFIEDL